jgi:hypothetical protein
MKLRTLSLGGAALASLLLLTPSAFAAPDYYNTNPTAEERAATDRLNAGAADRAHDDADANAADRAAFEARQNAVDRERARNDADRATYERDRARYDARYGDNRYDRDGRAHRWDAFYGYNGFRDVDSMNPRELRGLRVNTQAGSRVGMIRDVDANDRGRITRVAVSVGSGRLAWVDADDLRFDPATRVVFTTLSRDQVNSMARMHYPRF